MKTKRNKRAGQKRTTRAARATSQSQPFLLHLLELKRRVIWSVLSIVAGATAAYFVQQQIVALLLKPAGNQQFIYTSPGGGLNFLIMICLYTGVLVSIPVVMYNLLKFLSPVMSESSTKYILRGSMVAGLLAVAGVVFCYIYGLPSALRFLSHQFTSIQITAMIAVQSYLSFVMKFLLAAALIFQAPLLMLLINRIKPLKPSKLLKSERWVVMISFILGAVISPTPDVRSMLILSIPMILSFQVGVGLIWHANRRGRKPKSVLKLLEQDAAAQAERLQKLQSAFMMQFEQLEAVPVAAEMSSYAGASPDQTSLPSPAMSGGRTDYQCAMPAKRVRRRLIM